MARRSRKQLDDAILYAITGETRPDGIQIEEDYLIREAMENRRESGLEVPEDFQPTERPDDEKQDYKHRKWLEALEEARTKRLMEWEQHEIDFDDNYVPQPVREIVVII